MTMPVFRGTMRNVSATVIFAVFLGSAYTAGAQNNKKPAPAAKPAAQAPKPAAPARNSGGTIHTSTTTTSHTTTTTTSRITTTTPRTTTTTSLRTTTSTTPRGTLNTTSRSQFGTSAPRGSNERMTPHGTVVRTRPNGRLSDVHDPKRGIDVHHGLNGNRAISVERADHSRVFAERGRPGFVQRPYSFRGHDFARRTYFYHGREYSHFYHGFAYRGVYLNVYAPGFYYHAAFYGWAYHPWAMPIVFGWGWGADPWFGYYGYYFQPYPIYPSAAYWLTDYMISSDLQTAYAAHQDAGEVDGAPPATAGSPELTPDVKQQIADEVRAQLALENQEAQQDAQQRDVDPASSGIARMLSDGRPHVFLVGSAMDVVDALQAECALSDGDVLALRTPPPADATAADVVVLSSKGGNECQRQDTVSVALADLQEMQNHMRETIDQGLQDLQAKQGTGGLPALPPSAQSQPAPAQYAAMAPPPDANAATEIQQQTQQADQAEADATEGAGASTSAAPVNAPLAAPASPATVALGQTPDQVQGALGAPARVANLGSKVIYYYNGMKVTFMNGKVSDVQ
ncbi:MAG: hypothetical protein WBP85_04730 [Terracidiphilus sp.]